MIGLYIALYSVLIPFFLSPNEYFGRTHRILSIEGEQIEFSKGFTDLHTVSYQNILNGNSYGLGDAKNSIEIVSQIRNKK